jgi:hypothetical protein
MDTMIIFLLFLVAMAFGAWLMRWSLAHRTPAQIAADPTKRCGVCQCALDPIAVRTHDGKWRCPEHKTV